MFVCQNSSLRMHIETKYINTLYVLEKYVLFEHLTKTMNSNLLVTTTSQIRKKLQKLKVARPALLSVTVVSNPLFYSLLICFYWFANWYTTIRQNGIHLVKYRLNVSTVMVLLPFANIWCLLISLTKSLILVNRESIR
jgi:hypothetical protein